MKSLGIGYRNILALSLPIMLGSAGQNIVVLSDSIFLYHYDALSFAAMGLVGIFYLMLNSIGFSISKGAQILVARKMGERDALGIRGVFQNSLFILFITAFLVYFFLHFFADPLFSLMVQDEGIRQLCLDYLGYRSFGLFFSFLGFGMIGLYTGIGRTGFILVDTLFLLLANLFLNYSLIFGKFGFSEMGIVGAGLASTLSEGMAFVLFLLYLVWDGRNRKAHYLTAFSFGRAALTTIMRLSYPIVLQSMLSLGAWFLFFLLIEKMGAEALAISNLVRVVYLFLSVPYWGFSVTVSTFVSVFIGEGNYEKLFLVLKRSLFLCLSLTLCIAFPVAFYPTVFLHPLLGTEQGGLIQMTQPSLWVLYCILGAMSISGILFNAVMGAGGTFYSFRIQSYALVPYIALVYIGIYFGKWNIALIWGVELLYWGVIGWLSWIFLKGLDTKSPKRAIEGPSD
jgi:putative MATE family efflux protein